MTKPDLMERTTHLSSGLALLYLASNIAPNIETAKAATPATSCQGQSGELRVSAMQVPFYDLASHSETREFGRKGIFDKGPEGRPIDPWLEMPAIGGEAKALSLDGRELASNSFTTSPPSFPGFRVPHLEKKIAFAPLHWSDRCNTTMQLPDGRAVLAQEVYLFSTQDSDNRTFKVTIPLGEVLPVWFGKEIKKPQDFLNMVSTQPGIVRDLPADRKALIERTAQTESVTPTPGIKEPIKTTDLQKELDAAKARADKQAQELKTTQDLYYRQAEQLADTERVYNYKQGELDRANDKIAAQVQWLKGKDQIIADWQDANANYWKNKRFWGAGLLGLLGGLLSGLLLGPRVIGRESTIRETRTRTQPRT